MLEEYSMTRALLPSALLLTAHILVGCDSRPATSAAPPAPPVTTASPLQKTINEGQMVRQGDLLFVIDRRPYELTVDQAKADVDRAKAKLEIATLDVQRATPLVRSQALTEREFDTRKATERDAAGQVAASEAALKQAELNLEWSNVRAPTTGRISDRRVDAGNLITGGQSGATLLTVIVSIDPIHFLFDGSEADFLRYLRLAVTGARPSSRDVQNPVSVRLADETDYAHHGQMDFVD